MKSLASLSLFLLAGTPAAFAQEPPAGEGPRGSSELAAGEVRYDAVGYAGSGDLSGVSVASAALSAGSLAEITALDTGKTIVVAVVAGEVAPGQVVTVSNGAAAALGMTGDRFAVRVRKIVPTPQDIVQLGNGTAASFRADAPPPLLAALRRKLTPVTSVASRPPRPSLPARPAIKPAARPTAPISSGYVVQVAALSSAARAAAVAQAVDGSVIAGPPLWRVRLGPYPDAAAAARAKARAERKGYPGGQITRIP